MKQTTPKKGLVPIHCPDVQYILTILKIKWIDFYKRERTSLNRNLFSGEKYFFLFSNILDRERFIHRISKIKH